MSDRRHLRLAALACAIVLLLPSAATAQAAVATLSGRVTDAQDAVAPRATVTVRNLATGVTRTAASGSDGHFTIPFLPPGTYSVDVQLSGFAAWRADSIALQVGQDHQLDIRLAVGAVQEVVTVAEPRALTTAVDGVLSAETIETLPLNGRNFLELALLVPGNQPTPTFDPTKTNSVLVSSAGQLGRGGNITIDGQDNNDDVVGGPLLNLPIDAVQEFQIATNRFGADLGRSASSAINVVTRSGANTPQARLALRSRRRVAGAAGHRRRRPRDTPPFDRQQMSATFGGPLRRDRSSGSAPASSAIRTAASSSARATRPRARSRAASPTRPFDDGLWSLRARRGRRGQRFSGAMRASGRPIPASAVERAIGSATQRQEAMNRYNSVLGTWTLRAVRNFVNALT